MLVLLVKFIHIIVCVLLIVIVLLQADKGEGLSGAFGSGAAATLFGERGASEPIVKLTTMVAIVFMITSLILTIWIPKLESTKTQIELSSPKTSALPPVSQSLPENIQHTPKSETLPNSEK